MLTYIDVHLTYTLPVIVLLASITWPFLSRSELFKIAFVSTMAFVYTTPWDNYIIRHGAWTYEREKVLIVIGHVPLEEYAFFVVQTVMTLLWTLMCTRWSSACFHFNFDKTTYGLIRWLPISALTLTAVQGYRMAVPGIHTFYLGCILWWSCPVVAFLWFGAGNYFVKKSTTVAVSITVPTLYLCWVDRIALEHGVWHIAEKTTLNVFVAERLPLEECLFFLIANVMVVLGAMAVDKAHGLADTYPFAFPLRYDSSWSYNCQSIRAFVTAECHMPPSHVHDIRQCSNVLKTASNTFTMASFIFPQGVRLHLIILYAFCRVMDDIINNEPKAGVRKRKLALIERFIGELFADRNSDYDVHLITPREPDVDWSRYGPPELGDKELSCFRAVSRISFYLPRKLFEDLLKGYRWDVDGRTVEDENELLLYTTYVAGSMGALCVYVIMYKSGNCYRLDGDDEGFLIEKARKMGQVLQIVNICRDIVTDSETLGRCYVPAEYMNDRAAAETRAMCVDKNPWVVGVDRLKSYATRMIGLADRLRRDALTDVKLLPWDVRDPMLIAANVHVRMSFAITASTTYPGQASLSGYRKILIAVQSLYFGRFERYFSLDKLC